MPVINDILSLTEQLDRRAAEPYLRAHGWELQHQGSLGNRWRLRRDGRTRNLAVPVGTVDEDDQKRMFVTVLQTLADVENRSPVLIARDLQEAASDLLEFRVIAESLHAGEMPLRAAPELTEGAYDALLAAARAEVQRRPHYAQGTLPANVRGFLDEAKLAGTDRGSVILRVRTPKPAEPAQPTLDGTTMQAPLERRVVERLIAATRAAKAAAHRDPASDDPDIFDEDIEEGLSANLCDALLELAGTKSGLDGRVAVRVRWALTRPLEEPDARIDIERGELTRLSSVAEVLKQIDPRPNTEVVGPVTRLYREPGVSQGVIWMLADIEGKTRTVKLDLVRVDYERAMEAHRADQEVRAVGTLERAGRLRELSAATAFEIVG